ncbi:hypothetical protein [Candidatus Marimicrobium litorale]|uniref:Sulfotransferase family protein n=1 Tax=Candidatus Marimicrobium litorale TaxID=2518991 RepID=A0ABT3T134_9GAMM|nr:hypothetical protein [Candidatus Marimicrobium litorale]MCX2975966.1 hypothetical protein [Candidatus Marimicrobium litorale]
MIFNDKFIFVHIGKTGGMSCSRYLLENLDRPVYNCHKAARDQLRAPKLRHAIPMEGIGRHCTLIEAMDFIHRFNGKRLIDFERVVLVIRHPYSLEYSYFRHMQKPKILDKNRSHPFFAKLATLDFKTFIAKSNYHRRDHPQEKFFLVNNQIPDIVQLVRFEDLSTMFPRAVAPFTLQGQELPFPTANRTEYTSSIEEHLTEEVKELIYQKHKYMFDSGFYLR